MLTFRSMIHRGENVEFDIAVISWRFVVLCDTPQIVGLEQQGCHQEHVAHIRKSERQVVGVFGAQPMDLEDVEHETSFQHGEHVDVAVERPCVTLHWFGDCHVSASEARAHGERGNLPGSRRV